MTPSIQNLEISSLLHPMMDLFNLKLCLKNSENCWTEVWSLIANSRRNYYINTDTSTEYGTIPVVALAKHLDVNAEVLPRLAREDDDVMLSRSGDSVLTR
jgi:hypothetical protein